MKIALFSDLHLDFYDGEAQQRIIDRVFETSEDADLVINAGDTHEEYFARRFVASAIMSRGQRYIEVMGNHDHYGWGGSFEDVVSVVSFVDPDRKLDVVAGTQWTDFNGDPQAEQASRIFIRDFKRIPGISPAKMRLAFQEFKATVNEVKPELVVGHFAPSSKSILPKWEGHQCNPYFCPDMLPLAHQPKLWLHGHIHDPVDYEFEGTRVVANPLGYPGETYRSVQDYSCKLLEI